jgi:hypothetical protein
MAHAEIPTAPAVDIDAHGIELRPKILAPRLAQRQQMLILVAGSYAIDSALIPFRSRKLLR